ncbi:MAG: thioredoxin domain-containing protein [Archangium sp.]
MLRPEQVERLSRLLSGELADAEAQALHAELSQDPELMQAWERLLSLEQVAASLPSPVDSKLVDAVAARTAKPRQSRAPYLFVLAAAGVLLALWFAREEAVEVKKIVAVTAAVRTLDGTELVDDGDAHYRLERGTVMIDGDAHVVANGDDFEIHGRAIITTEPSNALAHVTDLVTPTNEVEHMIREAKSQWARAVVAVMVFSGHVQAADTIPAGKTFTKNAKAKSMPAPEVLNARVLDGVAPPPPMQVVNVTGLNKAVIAQGSAISSCYERELENGIAAGELTLLLTLARDGKLMESTVGPKSSLRHLGVQQCVLGAMQQVKYPPLKDVASAQLSYTLGFSRRGENGSELTLPADGDCEKCTFVNDRTEKVTVELGTSPSVGPANAKVTVVLFSEAECSFCIQAHGVLRELMKQYEGRVRFVYKHHPLAFHAGARPAAIALQAAAAQGRFWDMLNVTYDAPVSPETGLYDSQARSLGLDLQRYRRDVEAPATAAAVDADSAQAAKLGLKGVPAWIINGREIVGHRPLDFMREAIDAELEP